MFTLDVRNRSALRTFYLLGHKITFFVRSDRLHLQAVSVLTYLSLTLNFNARRQENKNIKKDKTPDAKSQNTMWRKEK